MRSILGDAIADGAMGLNIGIMGAVHPWLEAGAAKLTGA
jgi:hypothetical protein